MRTTVSISDELLVAAKRLAAERGQTLGEVIDDALRRKFAVPLPHGPRPQVPVFNGGSGAMPGIDLTSNAALHEALDEGVDLDGRR